MAIWTIKAEYDPDAQVWYSVEGDLPGLAVDGATLELLAEKAFRHLPDLLEINADLIGDKSRLQGPHRIRVIAHHEREFAQAA